MLTNKLPELINTALKARDELKLSTYKMLSSALSYDKIAKQHDLSEEEELAIVRSEAKKRRDAIEAYEKAGQTERAEKEKKELAILEEFLPAQMSDEDLEKIIDEAITATGATGPADMGRVIGMVMGKAKGQADGSRVSTLIKSKLIK